jgi:hypothetical protein
MVPVPPMTRTANITGKRHEPNEAANDNDLDRLRRDQYNQPQLIGA